jgi:hypothetical protein
VVDVSETSELDLIYDRLIADEKLKKGTKYERLGAIAFAALEERLTVHDLRLRGSSGVRHQIDVTAGPDNKRLLVECKQYDKKIGLGIVRDFFGVVEDLKPDQAFVVTTVGFTRDAIRYADAKGIRLAILRRAQPTDLEGRVQRVHVTLEMTGLHISKMEWEADPEDSVATRAADQPGRTVWPGEAVLVNPDGSTVTLEDFIQRHMDVGNAYEGEPGPRCGVHRFDAPRRLVIPPGPDLGVVAVKWEGDLTAGEHSFEIGVGIGGLVAELALLTASGKVMSVLSNRNIAQFSFDSRGRVIAT